MFQVKKEKCDQCLFTENKIVSNKRRKEILKGCKVKDNHFVCHKSSIDEANGTGNGNVCCKGFYDTQSSNLMRISGRLGMVEMVD